jgi:hypothetical protein
LEKGARCMEKVEASIVRSGDSVSLKLELDSELTIPLSNDDAMAVKSSFNALLQQLKGGLFMIAFNESGSDLFNQVAKEYVVQLNRELAEISLAMRQYDLVDCEDDES